MSGPRPMMRLMALIAALLMISTLCAGSVDSATSTIPQAVSKVSGIRAYEYLQSLENITKQYPAFRSTGSAGCNASADWIMDQMSALALQVHEETYDFPSWDLRSTPSLTVAASGDLNDLGAQAFRSFVCEQWSRSTGIQGVNGSVAALPLPAAANSDEIGMMAINTTAWNEIDTTGKIVLIGKEVRWSSNWEQPFVAKIGAQRPLAVISAYSYEWMSAIDEAQMGSAAGRPLSSYGPYLADLNLPAGVLNYSEGQALRALANGTARASVKIDSFAFTGAHRNLVGMIPGSDPDRKLLVTAHYDSVLTNGFCDNGAGVAGLLEMARVLSSAYREGSYRPIPDIMFVAFDSEEVGLVGSLEFVYAHQDIMRNVTATFNLDCIGNRDLRVTPTENSPAADARDAVTQAAAALGVAVSDETPGGSDQESFLHPDTIRVNARQRWGVSIGSAGMVANGNTVLLISYPLMNMDVWTMGQSGWIHTRNDRSGVSGWVLPAYMGQHVSVATMAVMSLSAGETPTPAAGTDILPFVLIAMVIIAIAVVAVLLLRRR